MFLNSNIRKLAKLPTRGDREAHQKQLYKRLLERAEIATIIYTGVRIGVQLNTSMSLV